MNNTFRTASWIKVSRRCCPPTSPSRAPSPPPPPANSPARPPEASRDADAASTIPRDADARIPGAADAVSTAPGAADTVMVEESMESAGKLNAEVADAAIVGTATAAELSGRGSI